MFSQSVRIHIRANLVGYVALFFALGLGTLLAAPSFAAAATILGQAPPTAGLPSSCQVRGNNTSVVQTNVASGNGYTVPAGGGVITEWRHLAGAFPDQTLRLRVFVAGPANTFTAVAESENRTLTPSTLNSFPARIPVAGGELIGLNNGPAGQSNTSCVYVNTSDPADQAFSSGDNVSPPLGASAGYLAIGERRVNIAAVLEPDCDRDGFGDETQDPDIASCSPADTTAPDTTITKGPKPKTKKKQATIEFSSEAGATFECSLNGAPYTPCTSPDAVKGKKGRNRFEVRARDAAGNVDGSPAGVHWKVKQKRNR